MLSPILSLEAQVRFAGSPGINRQISSGHFQVTNQLRANMAFAGPEKFRPRSIRPVGALEFPPLGGLNPELPHCDKLGCLLLDHLLDHQAWFRTPFMTSASLRRI